MNNQVGYLSKATKTIRVKGEDTSFILESKEDKTILFEGKLKDPINDPASGEVVYLGEFSQFNTPGEYTIKLLPSGLTEDIVIKDNAYLELQSSLLEMFYHQRCGYDLSQDRSGKWAHVACHTSKAVIYNSETKVDVSGGWHDAGDYGRYVGPGAKAVADLLLTNVLFPTSHSQASKVIDECLYELKWMLKMQDSISGAVYHKVTTGNFIDNVMPHTNSQELIISPVSSTATADFVAVMSLSSRLFHNTDPDFSESALLAALKGWNWLESHKDFPPFKNPNGVATGEYGDENDGDERFWASVELFLTTGDEDVHNYAMESYKKNKWEGLGWMNVGTYGVISYLFTQSPQKSQQFHNQLQEDFIDLADRLCEKCSTDGYGISLGKNYPWGSNEVIADNGMILLLSEKITGKEEYKERAQAHLDYLLGSNSLGLCFVTGFGTKSIEHPHHRPSTAVGAPMPGMLSGGPNMLLLDPLAEEKLKGVAPAKCFLDEEPSYSTNEITIYWNSPLYFLVSAFVE